MIQCSLIIPAYNEEHRLESTLELYTTALHERFAEQFEIIVVANGCRDNTVQVAQTRSERDRRVRVIDIPDAIGKGGAVLEGLRLSLGQKVLFADADAATAPESLIELLDALDRYDVVIGSRRHRESVIARRQPLKRRLFSGAFARLVRLLFQTDYRDTQCGAKAFRQGVVPRLLWKVSEPGWAFDVDLLLSARSLGLSVHEHPIVWTDRDGSQLRLLPTLRQVLPAMWRLRQRDQAPTPLHVPAMVELERGT